MSDVHNPPVPPLEVDAEDGSRITILAAVSHGFVIKVHCGAVRSKHGLAHVLCEEERGHRGDHRSELGARWSDRP
jgi:hypothetical protein